MMPGAAPGGRRYALPSGGAGFNPMRIRRTTSVLLALAAALLGLAATAGAAVPARFFGIAPQTHLTTADTARMAYGGLDTIRLPVPWYFLEPSPGVYDWTLLDQAVGDAASSGLEVLPFVYGSPRWVAAKPETLPVNSARQRRAWGSFLSALVARYRPGGQYWVEHGPGTADPVPEVPFTSYQIWNEANFFYFAVPASPTRYARLLKQSAGIIRAGDPQAKVILSGLFANPAPKPPKAMKATDFLTRLYAVPGIKRYFDAVALHPYAANAATLKTYTTAVRKVIVQNHDAHTPLWITEMGWGSQGHSNVSFEKGWKGQARELTAAYRYLIGNRRKLNLKRTYWFSWKDLHPAPCTYCDSVGLFGAGADFHPKPAWYSLVALTGGNAGEPPGAPPPPPVNPPPLCDPLPICLGAPSG
jgi:hypothetical protein